MSKKSSTFAAPAVWIKGLPQDQFFYSETTRITQNVVLSPAGRFIGFGGSYLTTYTT